MESLLNILWLLLLLPAIQIWRQGPTSARISRRLQRARSFVLLCCILALLFPVVSATDDLRALQPEAEESVVAKHTVKQSANSKSLVWSNGGGSNAELLKVFSIAPASERVLVSHHQEAVTTEERAGLIHGRAPPSPEPQYLVRH
jgi:hypothetical protein